MLDAYEMQKREKQRLKELKENGQYENRNGFSDFDVNVFYMFTGIIMFGLILGVIAMVIVDNDHKENLNECESIGGNYEVIDRKAGFRSVVDVYGCVKQ